MSCHGTFMNMNTSVVGALLCSLLERMSAASCTLFPAPIVFLCLSSISIPREYGPPLGPGPPHTTTTQNYVQNRVLSSIVHLLNMTFFFFPNSLLPVRISFVVRCAGFVASVCLVPRASASASPHSPQLRFEIR